MSPERQTPLDRLNYSGELGVVINRLAGAYDIGSPTSFSVINIEKRLSIKKVRLLCFLNNGSNQKFYRHRETAAFPDERGF